MVGFGFTTPVYKLVENRGIALWVGGCLIFDSVVVIKVLFIKI